MMYRTVEQQFNCGSHYIVQKRSYVSDDSHNETTLTKITKPRSLIMRAVVRASNQMSDSRSLSLLVPLFVLSWALVSAMLVHHVPSNIALDGPPFVMGMMLAFTIVSSAAYCSQRHNLYGLSVDEFHHLSNKAKLEYFDALHSCWQWSSLCDKQQAVIDDHNNLPSEYLSTLSEEEAIDVALLSDTLKYNQQNKKEADDTLHRIINDAHMHYQNFLARQVMNET